ncbi:MAG: class I SAM-dependent methyltransferase [Pseudomonadota bacterium]
MNCRFCGTRLQHEFIDMVNAPPSNSFLTRRGLDEPETFYPLKLYVCESCFLVQIDEYKRSNEIFSEDYIYYSSFSKTWLDHARTYVGMICERFGFDKNSFVIEIASNDGYLLQNFVAKGIPCLGIEPSCKVAEVARGKGIDVITRFFCADLAGRLVAEGRSADLMIGNNVLAHVPDINDFVAALKLCLNERGVVTLEFPHLLQLIEKCQFDTIYHEHFSYLSLLAARRIFVSHGLDLFDVEELETHGGSLRVYLKHVEDRSRQVVPAVDDLMRREEALGMRFLDYYRGFQVRADNAKYALLTFLIEKKLAGQTVAAYGAAAKGNTLLNYCGVKKDLIEFVVDASPHKQGKFLPGSHIPVVNESRIKDCRPDYVLILPWNIRREIIDQLDYISDWGGKFISLHEGRFVVTAGRSNKGLAL